MLGIFLDVETNGLNPKRHRILEIALKIVDLDNGFLINQYESIVFHQPHVWQQSDPESLKINGFSYERLRLGKTEDQASRDIITILTEAHIQRGKAVFICQNPSFDRMFFTQIIDTDIQEKLNWPYHWLDLASMFWGLHVKGVCHEKNTSETLSLSKNAIAKRLGLEEEEMPHRAMNGVNHLLLCYEAVVGYPLAKVKANR